jgi:hypothetical protein
LDPKPELEPTIPTGKTFGEEEKRVKITSPVAWTATAPDCVRVTGVSIPSPETVTETPGNVGMLIVSGRIVVGSPSAPSPGSGGFEGGVVDGGVNDVVKLHVGPVIVLPAGS